MATQLTFSANDTRPAAQVGCVMVPRFPLACELAERPELWGQPVAVARPDAPVVWSASPAAIALGVTEGQRLSEAVGRCQSLVTFDAKLARYEAIDEMILDALDEATPGVEPVELGIAYVQLDDLVRYYRTPSALHARLLDCIPAELRPRLGVGPTKFVARLAASQAAAGDVREVADHDVAAFLAPVPIGELPVDAEVVRRMQLVGVTTVGQLMELPGHALIAQFGSEGARLVELLDGAAEPVHRRPHDEWLEERLAFPEPLTSREAMLAAAAQLLHRLLRHPERRDRAARQIVVRAETELGTRWESTVTLRRPRDDRDGMWIVLAPAIERASIPGPVTELSIELHELCSSWGQQEQLFPTGTARHASDEQWERIEDGLRQLSVRYGRCPVGRLIPVEPWSRIPERRWALVDLE